MREIEVYETEEAKSVLTMIIYVQSRGGTKSLVSSIIFLKLKLV